jgi:hypothetical protein
MALWDEALDPSYDFLGSVNHQLCFCGIYGLPSHLGDTIMDKRVSGTA